LSDPFFVKKQETPESPPSARIIELSLIRNPPDSRHVGSTEELRKNAEALANRSIALVSEWASRGEAVSFRDFENALRTTVFAFARVLITLFLVLRDEQVMRLCPEPVIRGDRTFRIAPAIARNLVTLFGVVRYQRRYMREVTGKERHGFFPLDVELGLTSDRFSWNVLSTSVLLATKLSFAEARSTLALFVPNAPSTEVIEQSILGFGRYTPEWFETAPAPHEDGDVLIVMFDSKGAPMATETELSRRRGKRRKCRGPKSARHRGRVRRGRHPRKPRRKKGDKSKNAKMATMFVMYTLKRHGKKLIGPINRKVYASFAPKRHAFEIARREANKRGFTLDSGKLVQIVIDGDDDLAIYAREFFPEAKLTIDVIHVIEKLWSAGESIHREDSHALPAWIEKQKKRLYSGRVNAILAELRHHLKATPKTGPGNKGKRERLEKAIRYIKCRVGQMHYDKLIALDLEISSGPMEGSIKNVIGKRFDHGGMRWIKERAEALLQLRCIETNGDWESFINHVHEKIRDAALKGARQLSLQSREPAPLPILRNAA
jgi:hypothetical protein